MLTRAEDYVCVDTTGFSGPVVTGDIMPARDNRGDGSWRAMKYEDLLFLQEANRERQRALVGIPATKSSPYGRALYSGRIFDVCIRDNLNAKGDGTVARHYLKPDAEIPASPTAVTTLGDFFDNLLITSADLAAITNPSGVAERKFDGDLVRKAYWNLAKLHKTYSFIGYGNPLVVHTKEDVWSSPDGEEMRHYENEYDSPPSYLYFFGGTSISGNSLRKPTLTWLQNIPVAYPWVTAAKLVVRINTHRVNPSADYSELLTFDCTVTNHTIAVPTIDAWAMARAACQRHGVPFYDTYAYTLDTTQHGRVEWIETALVCDHTFPAEIDSLNWSWQPAGSE